MTQPLVIAIDGPAGAGKSTVARQVAAALHYIYIDTGAMYRAITWAALRRGVDLDDPQALEALARSTSVRLERRPDSGAVTVLLDGEDVSEEIRRPEVDEAVPRVAQVPGVRSALVEQQRAMAGRGGVVVDGRDIGSHVLPDADRKFFLTASLEERTRRRAADLLAKGHDVTLEQVRRDLERRDDLDTHRATAPLVQAPDAIRIDSTGKSIFEVVGEILSYCGAGGER